ncbi:MAG: 2-oxoacid:acceptor oxidoreductase family protein [Deltaproteobacteria bacterium]|nr:2-oxoacid:acceptor oxidoreductase family protein [Deltaproteobacteria bacterium]
MENYIEVRWHGRAQQGVVTAAKVLGEACLHSGKFVQAFPEFGPERMGAPVRAFNRISDEPIRLHCQVTDPRYVLIADPTLIGTVDVTAGTPEDAVFIVNTPKPATEMRAVLGIKSKTVKVFTLDAGKISFETIGRVMPNTPMLGALAKATGFITLDALVENFKENYSKKFAPKVIEGNVAALKLGFSEVKGDYGPRGPGAVPGAGTAGFIKIRCYTGYL